ncbi:MAG: zinc ribbon domain-containing protein [Nitrososphaeria archaeon]
MSAIEFEAQEYGMKAYEVIKYNTSKHCAYNGVEVRRNPRVLVYCPRGHKLHSDLNSSLNILKKATGFFSSKYYKAALISCVT